MIVTRQIIFAARCRLGAGIDPTTGQYFDTKRYVDTLPVGTEKKRAIFEENVRRTFLLLHAQRRRR